jgi:hypothetical protein
VRPERHTAFANRGQTFNSKQQLHRKPQAQH